MIVIIETPSMYRSIENYSRQNEIDYIHYEHPKAVIQFNTSPEIKLCLIKIQHLLNLSLEEPVFDRLDDFGGKNLAEYEPYQYKCITSACNILFPDPEWFKDIRLREEVLNKCFNFYEGDIIRHYFLLKGTYEERWMTRLKEEIIKYNLYHNDEED